MDHRPFEDWLLDSQTLSPEQQRELNAHLRSCSSCTAIAEVNLALSSVREMGPAAGFSERFQVRMAYRKQAMRRRIFWGFLLLTISALGLMAWVVWPVLRDLFLSPINLLASWVTSLASIWAALQAITRTGVDLFNTVPTFIPIYIWMAILAAAGTWCVIWVVSLIKLTRVSEGV